MENCRQIAYSFTILGELHRSYRHQNQTQMPIYVSYFVVISKFSAMCNVQKTMSPLCNDAMIVMQVLWDMYEF